MAGFEDGRVEPEAQVASRRCTRQGRGVPALEPQKRTTVWLTLDFGSRRSISFLTSMYKIINCGGFKPLSL